MDINLTIEKTDVKIYKEEYYNQHIEDYIDDQDPDLLFTDNCHNHKEYDLESEECSVISFNEIKEAA